MLKNFSPQSLGINGRQSELIELALTYGFRGMDVDMAEMFRRSQRSSVDDAAKYLRAAENLCIGGFNLEVDLDAEDDVFTSQVGALHPIADLAAEMEATRAYVAAPPATDRLAYPEYFDQQCKRLAQICEVLAPKNIRLGVALRAGKELAEGKQFEFVRNVEGFLALVRSIGNPAAGFYVDTWDWVIGDGAMDQLSELKADEIVAVRLGSVPGDVDQSQATTQDRTLPEKEGVVNHVNLVKHLATIGYEGPISPSASSAQYKGQTRESTVQKAQEAVDGISTDAGLPVSPLPMDLIEDLPYEPTPSAS